MRTDLLIEMLAREAGPAPRAVVARRLIPAMLMGLAASSAWLWRSLVPCHGTCF